MYHHLFTYLIEEVTLAGKAAVQTALVPASEKAEQGVSSTCPLLASEAVLRTGTEGPPQVALSTSLHGDPQLNLLLCWKHTRWSLTSDQ